MPNDFIAVSDESDEVEALLNGGGPETTSSTFSLTETDPYVILGIARNATLRQVTVAYRTLAKRYHPDRVTLTPETADRMRMVNDAYEKIKNYLHEIAAQSER